MMNDTRGAWYFESLSHSNTILAIEPDGTQHVVRFGDMNSAAGIALLNAMTRDLAKSLGEKKIET